MSKAMKPDPQAAGTPPLELRMQKALAAIQKIAQRTLAAALIPSQCPPDDVVFCENCGVEIPDAGDRRVTADDVELCADCYHEVPTQPRPRPVVAYVSDEGDETEDDFPSQTEKAKTAQEAEEDRFDANFPEY